MITNTTATQQDEFFFSLMVILISYVPREKQNMEHHADQGTQMNIFLLVLLLRELK